MKRSRSSREGSSFCLDTKGSKKIKASIPHCYSSSRKRNNFKLASLKQKIILIVSYSSSLHIRNTRPFFLDSAKCNFSNTFNQIIALPIHYRKMSPQRVANCRNAEPLWQRGPATSLPAVSSLRSV